MASHHRPMSEAMRHRSHEALEALGPPAGACALCGSDHEPFEPHNREDLGYQIRFYQRFGRAPTWQDAMAHCPLRVRIAWIDALLEAGVVL